MKVKTKLLVQNITKERHYHKHFHMNCGGCDYEFASSPSDAELTIQVEGITIVEKK